MFPCVRLWEGEHPLNNITSENIRNRKQRTDKFTRLNNTTTTHRRGGKVAQVKWEHTFAILEIGTSGQRPVPDWRWVVTPYNVTGQALRPVISCNWLTRGKHKHERRGRSHAACFSSPSQSHGCCQWWRHLSDTHANAWYTKNGSRMVKARKGLWHLFNVKR